MELLDKTLNEDSTYCLYPPSLTYRVFEIFSNCHDAYWNSPAWRDLMSSLHAPPSDIGKYILDVVFSLLMTREHSYSCSSLLFSFFLLREEEFSQNGLKPLLSSDLKALDELPNERIFPPQWPRLDTWVMHGKVFNSMLSSTSTSFQMSDALSLVLFHAWEKSYSNGFLIAQQAYQNPFDFPTTPFSDFSDLTSQVENHGFLDSNSQGSVKRPRIVSSFSRADSIDYSIFSSLSFFQKLACARECFFSDPAKEECILQSVTNLLQSSSSSFVSFASSLHQRFLLYHLRDKKGVRLPHFAYNTLSVVNGDAFHVTPLDISPQGKRMGNQNKTHNNSSFTLEMLNSYYDCDCLHSQPSLKERVKVLIATARLPKELGSMDEEEIPPDVPLLPTLKRLPTYSEIYLPQTNSSLSLPSAAARSKPPRIDRIPLLLVLVKQSFSCELDATAAIVDPFGPARAVVHRLCLEQNPEWFDACTVLVLRDCAVHDFGPTRTLNIIPRNIYRVFGTSRKTSDENEDLKLGLGKDDVTLERKKGEKGPGLENELASSTLSFGDLSGLAAIVGIQQQHLQQQHLQQQQQSQRIRPLCQSHNITHGAPTSSSKNQCGEENNESNHYFDTHSYSENHQLETSSQNLEYENNLLSDVVIPTSFLNQSPLIPDHTTSHIPSTRPSPSPPSIVSVPARTSLYGPASGPKTPSTKTTMTTPVSLPKSSAVLDLLRQPYHPSHPSHSSDPSCSSHDSSKRRECRSSDECAEVLADVPADTLADIDDIFDVSLFNVDFLQTIPDNISHTASRPSNSQPRMEHVETNNVMQTREMKPSIDTEDDVFNFDFSSNFEPYKSTNHEALLTQPTHLSSSIDEDPSSFDEWALYESTLKTETETNEKQEQTHFELTYGKTESHTRIDSENIRLEDIEGDDKLESSVSQPQDGDIANFDFDADFFGT